MCLSGDVTALNNSQWKVIDEGIAFYKKIAPVIKEGKTYFYGENISSYRHPNGWQAILRENKDLGEAVVIIHGFNQAKGKTISITIPNEYEIKHCYSFRDEKIDYNNRHLKYTFPDDMYAIALYLTKK